MPPPVSSQMSLKRIHREIADVKKEDLGPITLSPTDNLFVWKGSIPGPQASPYEGGVFNVDVVLATDYPFSAPKVTFSTRIYHMNISDRGNICIDILKHNWSPALSLFKVMLSLSSLLTDPNPQDPLVPTIATEFVRNRALHDKTAREWTELYAKPKVIAAPPAPVPVPVSVPTPAPPVAGPASGAMAGASGSRAKGKSRAKVPTTTNSRGPRSETETITIDDSEDDVEISLPKGKGKGRKRKRENESTSAGPVGEIEVVDLTDEESTGRKSKTRRRVGAGSSTSGDVIVIDD